MLRTQLTWSAATIDATIDAPTDSDAHADVHAHTNFDAPIDFDALTDFDAPSDSDSLTDFDAHLRMRQLLQLYASDSADLISRYYWERIKEQRNLQVLKPFCYYILEYKVGEPYGEII